MTYSRVRIAAFGWELPPHVVTSAALDDRLAPVYAALGLGPRQIEPLTGVRERRFWGPNPQMSDGAVRAGRKALCASGVPADEVGLLIYAGVCRDQLEPATACAVADGLGLSGRTEVYDISNACLGVLNGMVQVASAIELGHTKAGMVVSCESAREIIDVTVEHLLGRRDMETFKTSLATLTGGSGAVAVVLTATDAQAFSASGGQGGRSAPYRAPAPERGPLRRLVGGVARSACEHHRLCRWGPDTPIPARVSHRLETHAVAVLDNGVELGARTWADFLAQVGWPDGPDKIICHQVGSANREAILRRLRIARERDFATFPFLGNIGTVSLPLTAALAEERGFLAPGDRVGLLGIGSGLNCLMLGVEW